MARIGLFSVLFVVGIGCASPRDHYVPAPVPSREVPAGWRSVPVGNLAAFPQLTPSEARYFRGKGLVIVAFAAETPDAIAGTIAAAHSEMGKSVVRIPGDRGARYSWWDPGAFEGDPGTLHTGCIVARRLCEGRTVVVLGDWYAKFDHEALEVLDGLVAAHEAAGCGK